MAAMTSSNSDQYWCRCWAQYLDLWGAGGILLLSNNCKITAKYPPPAHIDIGNIGLEVSPFRPTGTPMHPPGMVKT